MALTSEPLISSTPIRQCFLANAPAPGHRRDSHVSFAETDNQP
jgi:hypothetical protein